MALFQRKRKVRTGYPPSQPGTGFAITSEKAPYVSVHGGGYDGGNMPDVTRQQPAIGLKEFGPPADQPPGTYWQRRNAWRIDNFRHDRQTPPQYPQTNGRYRPADDPKREPPLPNRVTAFLSPSSTRFVTASPIGSRQAKRLNGNHFSMASHRRAYPIGGMEPARRFRNTYRIEPDSREDRVTDLPPETNDQKGEVTFTSPVVVPSFRAYRLGG